MEAYRFAASRGTATKAAIKVGAQGKERMSSSALKNSQATKATRKRSSNTQKLTWHAGRRRQAPAARNQLVMMVKSRSNFRATGSSVTMTVVPGWIVS